MGASWDFNQMFSYFPLRSCGTQPPPERLLLQPLLNRRRRLCLLLFSSRLTHNATWKIASNAARALYPRLRRRPRPRPRLPYNRISRSQGVGPHGLSVTYRSAVSQRVSLCCLWAALQRRGPLASSSLSPSPYQNANISLTSTLPPFLSISAGVEAQSGTRLGAVAGH